MRVHEGWSWFWSVPSAKIWSPMQTAQLPSMLQNKSKFFGLTVLKKKKPDFPFFLLYGTTFASNFPKEQLRPIFISLPIYPQELHVKH
jgi:hypothetical protein